MANELKFAKSMIALRCKCGSMYAVQGIVSGEPIDEDFTTDMYECEKDGGAIEIVQETNFSKCTCPENPNH